MLAARETSPGSGSFTDPATGSDIWKEKNSVWKLELMRDLPEAHTYILVCTRTPNFSLSHTHSHTHTCVLSYPPTPTHQCTVTQVLKCAHRQFISIPLPHTHIHSQAHKSWGHRREGSQHAGSVPRLPDEDYPPQM